VSHHRLPLRAVEIGLSCALLFPSTLEPQSPAQPGRLVIKSNPKGATIKIDKQTLGEKTDATFVVPAGKHRVAVSGGGLNCPEIEVEVLPGAPRELHCPDAWK